MLTGDIAITGIGSVSVFGPLEGLIRERECSPRELEWTKPRVRKARIVPPFRPAAVVPGLKTRRLDRLSVWSLVSASLALRDARIDWEREDRSRCAVAIGSGLGCIETTEAFFRTVAASGYGMADPILFPDSLDNAPASHVARTLSLTGPNIAFSCRGVSGEAALMESASLLRSGEADMAVAMAGDTLTPALYEWLEAAGSLSQECFPESAEPRAGFTPGEGLAALVLEPVERATSRGAALYATFVRGASCGDPQATASSWPRDGRALARAMRRALGDVAPSAVRWIISSANGAPALDHLEADAIREVFDDQPEPRLLAPKFMLGEFDGNAVLRLALALSGSTVSGLGMMLGASAGGGCAALLLNAP